MKTVILMHETQGPLTLWYLLHRIYEIPTLVLRRPGNKTPKKDDPKNDLVGKSGWPPTVVGATMATPATKARNGRLLDLFNRSKHYKVLIGVIEEFGEGVSFRNVRRPGWASLRPHHPLRSVRWGGATQLAAGAAVVLTGAAHVLTP